MKLSFLWVMLLAMLISAFATPFIGRLVCRFDVLLDKPNHRSLHGAPIPRVGGICVWLAIFSAPLLAGAKLAIGGMLLGAILLVVLISLLDDWRAQPVLLRLSTQLIAAAVAMTALFPGEWALIAVVSVVVGWAGNLFNFMDGSDGLAGCMAMIGFATLGFLASEPSPAIATIAFAVAGASAGFLFFNLPPARVFLGDAGSVPLGFTAAILSIWGVRDDVWHWLLPVLVFSPFLLDASWTLVDRVRRRERFWLAHREHLYQRLILAGWTHGRLLTVSVVVMLTVAGGTLLFSTFPRSSAGIAAGLACLCLATLYAAARWSLARRIE